eukprot:TRINITY_DN4639_c0_g1_i15.p1 TRINITY_DN4639_c0_g1~~TRINITY_DN4639_c0_g1_i15.p1  ORF type:complete len:257 (-),score=47.50 TRINITY_DN4639_c0_g1_i15:79-849(-)
MSVKEFHQICRNGKLSTLKKMVAREPDVIHLTDFIGGTGLHAAATFGRADVIRILLDMGCQPNLQDINGQTALHLAAIPDHEEAFKVLLERGCDPNIKDKNGDRAIDLAVRLWELHKQFSNLEAAKKSAKRRGVLRLHEAVNYGGDIEKIRKLLERRDCDPNAQDVHGWTVLHWAVNNGQVDLVRFFLERGCDLNIKDDNGVSAVDLARSRVNKYELGMRVHQCLDLMTAFQDKLKNKDLAVDINNNYVELEITKI